MDAVCCKKILTYDALSVAEMFFYVRQDIAESTGSTDRSLGVEALVVPGERTGAKVCRYTALRGKVLYEPGFQDHKIVVGGRDRKAEHGCRVSDVLRQEDSEDV